MAVFSNSSNQKHSILAGYQRRANQLKARSTSRYNVGTNLGSIKDRINDEYNQRFAPPYDDPKKLQDKVNKWMNHQEKVLVTSSRRRKAESARVATAVNNQNKVLEAHKEINAELQKMAQGRAEEVDANKVAKNTRIIQEIDKTYTPESFEVVDTRLKQKVIDARKRLVLAEEANAKALQVSDKVHLKAVEDFMVDGRLVRESKAAGMIGLTTLLTLGAAGVIYYGFLQGGKTTRRVSGNKSAAMAVFG
tara:strand:- start:172 stop:918 length:747 start_codon:yes stop_codon:yes gene_type:complete